MRRHLNQLRLPSFLMEKKCVLAVGSIFLKKEVNIKLNPNSFNYRQCFQPLRRSDWHSKIYKKMVLELYGKCVMY